PVAAISPADLRLWREYWLIAEQLIRIVKNKRELHTPPHTPSSIPTAQTTWKKMVNYIATAVQNHDNTFICVVLDVYPKSAITWEVLDLIMKTTLTRNRDKVITHKPYTYATVALRLQLEPIPSNIPYLLASSSIRLDAVQVWLFSYLYS
ncbi:hypothetical protein STEG23_027159, partial [Scotinomys teguina]